MINCIRGNAHLAKLSLCFKLHTFYIFYEPELYIFLFQETFFVHFYNKKLRFEGTVSTSCSALNFAEQKEQKERDKKWAYFNYVA